MREHIRTMVILGLVFFALLFVWLLTMPGHDAAQETATQRETGLLQAGADDIVGIAWENAGNAVAIRRDGDSWRISGYDDLRAVKDRAEALTRYLSELTPSRTIGAGGDLSAYGLVWARDVSAGSALQGDGVELTGGTSDHFSNGGTQAAGMREPAASGKKVTVELADRSRIFSIGNRTPSGAYYVLDEQGTVYLLPAGFADICSLTLADIAVKESVPLLTDADTLRIRTREHVLDARKTGVMPAYSYSSHYVWFTEEDGTMLPLDSIRIADLLAAVRRLSFDTIEETAASAEVIAAYGLDDPDIRLSVSGGGRSYTLLFRAASESVFGDVVSNVTDAASDEPASAISGLSADGRYFCMFEGSPMIYGTDGSVPALLAAASVYDGLRPEDVFRLDWSAVQAFDVELDGQTYTIQKSSGVTAKPAADAAGRANAGSVSVTDTVSAEMTYTLNGQPLSAEKVDALRAYLERIETSGQWDGVQMPGEELVGFVFYCGSERFPELEMRFFACTDGLALERFDGENRQLVSIYAVEGVRQLCRELLASVGAGF